MTATPSETSSSSYTPLSGYPTSTQLLDDSVKSFFREFYAVSDTPGSIDAWVDFFGDADNATTTTTCVVGNDVAHGKDELRKLREKMWVKVSARKHTLSRIFPATNFTTTTTTSSESDECEVMLLGSVVYKLKPTPTPTPTPTGGTEEELTKTVDWVAHAHIRRSGHKEGEGRRWRFVYYRVYLQT
ncbi:hypothetical protein QBC46DRAFT_157778 [Diplogelasinospora grovesii]|uniref:SnoaL-like domain-containing protein n=1 Tax=Diplogelasinospora grovesii TaxID=303347 RepID=A0AAN6NIE7_9PEZI|nr:hypothetical protein QBC46DRAFT_157778 [Diplogelasinospora grovesii]